MRVLDTFSGIGGFSVGLERAGMRTIGFSEIDPYCCAVLSRHWPNVPNHGDIRTLTGISADVVSGGFPCQDLSVAGKGAGLSGARSGLWWELHRVLREIAEAAQARGEAGPILLAENVSALRSRGLEDVLGSLAAIGYDAEWHCIPAAAVGAPHRRDRVWIIAHPQRHPLWHNQQRTEAGWDNVFVGGEALSGEHGPTRVVADSNGDVGFERGLGNAREGARGRHSHRGGLCAQMADAHGGGQQELGDAELAELKGASRHQPDRCGSRRLRDRPCVANPNSARPQERRQSQLLVQLPPVIGGGWWHPESGMGRNFDGIPAGVDPGGWVETAAWERGIARIARDIPARTSRLRALGNSLVPQIAEFIGREIMKRCASKLAG